MKCGKWKSVQCNKRRCRGFTLLEVIVALGIVSVGILAVSRAITGYAGTTITLEQRMVASWVASNRLETLRILAAKPEVGDSSGSEEMAGRTWYFQETVSTTADPLLFRVDVLVYADRDKLDEVGALSGYVLDAPALVVTNASPPAGLSERQPPSVDQPDTNQDETGEL